MAIHRRGVTALALAPALAFLCLPMAASAAEFFSGDQVVFSGGPSSPPESRDTGLRVEVGLRGGSVVRQDGAPRRRGETTKNDARRPAVKPLRYSDLSAYPQDELRDIAHDGQVDRRASALRSLAQLPKDELEAPSWQTVRNSLYDDDWRVVALGARLLGDLTDHQSVPPLIRLVDIGQAPVEQAAVRALGKIGDGRALPSLQRVAGLDIAVLSPLARSAIGQIQRKQEQKQEQGHGQGQEKRAGAGQRQPIKAVRPDVSTRPDIVQ